MSTRCNVIVELKTKNVILYRHHDGYPECTGRQLKEIVRNVKSEKGTTRQILSYLKSLKRKLYHGQEARLYEDTDSIHGDIEYLYTITKDLKVKTKTVRCFGGM